ncbi:hypothetical protein U9M48_038499 [Paspalum notatum var. saurae]|uniref:Uncharacterized protein n=1 Tax=Paspalum notatum var. saurae TaxID=547442 RepID=A0AAQ3UIN5_PASNO
MSTTDICRRTRKVSLMLLALNSLKLSAQSPPWRRNARPTAASASRSSSLRASPAKTMGGNASTVRSTSSSSALSGYSGCCSAGRPRQLPTDHWLGGRGAERTARARRSAPRESAGPPRPVPGEGSAGLGSSAGSDCASGILRNTAVGLFWATDGGTAEWVLQEGSPVELGGVGRLRFKQIHPLVSD